MKKSQSIPNGTIAYFNAKGMINELSEIEEVDKEFIKALQRKLIKITSLETYTELGDKDYEYYNIQFVNFNYEITGLSGYHIDLT